MRALCQSLWVLLLLALTGGLAACLQEDAGARSKAPDVPVPAPAQNKAGPNRAALKPDSGSDVIDISKFVNADGLFSRPVAATSLDGMVWLIVSQNTVGRTEQGTGVTRIEIIPLAVAAGTTVIGAAYRLGPESATFSPEATILVAYDPALLPGGFDEKRLVLARLDDRTRELVPLKNATVHTQWHTIEAGISRLGTFAIIPQPRPAAFSVRNLTISPAEVNLGENMSIGVTITNVGDLDGSYEVLLGIDNKTATSDNVSLAPGASERLVFSVTVDVAGRHTVRVGGLSGTYLVRQKAVKTATPAPPKKATPVPSQPPPRVWQIIESSLSAASYAGRSVSFTRMFDKTATIDAVVEISPLGSNTQLRDDWYVDILDANGNLLNYWQGNWRQDNKHELTFAVPSPGLYRIRVRHFSSSAQSLFIRISPRGWRHTQYAEP